MLSTITRMSEVMSLFTSASPEWGVREAAVILGTPRSNAHVILASLAEVGFLQRTTQGRYRLGWRLLAMNRQLIDGAGFKASAAVVLNELAAVIQDTVTIAVWDGQSAVRLVSIGGSRAGSIRPRPSGTRARAHATALGKVLLAGATQREVAAILSDAQLIALTSWTECDPTRLLDELAEIQETGVARSLQESARGVACLGVPVRGRSGEFLAALSVSAPLGRLIDEEPRYRHGLTSAAGRIANILLANDISLGDMPVAAFDGRMRA